MSAKAAAVKPGDLPPAAESGGGGKKKKLLLIVAVLVVVLVAGGGAAAYFLLGGKKKAKGAKGAKADAEHAEGDAHGEADADAEADAADAEEDSGKSKPPVYLSLESFTVNLASEAADRYLQVGIDVKLSGPDMADKIKMHLPEVRNGILLILTSKRVDELGTAEGKNKLRTEIRDAVNRPIGLYKAPPAGTDLAKWKPKKGALDVLLTNFVIQ